MAIKKAEEITFPNKKFTIIVAGAPGLGKSSLALSAPKPLLFDFDKGISRVKAEHRCDTSSVDSYEELLEDMTSDTYRACETVVIDTGGSLVQLMKPWAKKQDKKAAKNGMAMFGIIKQEFERLCWQIRNDNKNIVIIFHTTEITKGDTVTTRLSCEGSAKDIVWTPADFGGYMQMTNEGRTISFTPTDEYFAKGSNGINGTYSVPTLKDGVKNDFLTNLFKQASDVLAEEVEILNEKRQKYNSAMEKGRVAIENIVDKESNEQALELLKSLEHSLTSRQELLALYSAKKATLPKEEPKAENNEEQI